MPYEFIEFRIPVSSDDIHYFRELTDLMDDFYADLGGAIKDFQNSGRTYSESVCEIYRRFKENFTDWAELCTRLSILNRHNPDSIIDGRPIYSIREGITGDYKEKVLTVNKQYDSVMLLFLEYNSLSKARDRLEREIRRQEKEDDLPF